MNWMDCSTPTADFELWTVSAESAWRWAKGEIFDDGLDRSRPEILYLHTLGNIASYPACLAEIQKLQALHDLKAAIAHSVSPVMNRHYQKLGCVPVLEEHVVWRGQEYHAIRFVIPPPVWLKWLSTRPGAKLRCHHPQA